MKEKKKYKKELKLLKKVRDFQGKHYDDVINEISKRISLLEMYIKDIYEDDILE